MDIAEALLAQGANVNLRGEDVMSAIIGTRAEGTESALTEVFHFPAVTPPEQRRKATLVRLLRGAKDK